MKCVYCANEAEHKKELHGRTVNVCNQCLNVWFPKPKLKKGQRQ